MSQPAERAVPVILFDGVCNLCSAWVAWILEHDKRNEFRFASLQSDAARAALAAAGVRAGPPESVVLIDEAGVHTRSDAVIRIARRLGFPGALIAAGSVVPRPLRDAVYAWVARNRYGWFGRQNACMVPTPQLRSRFLDASEVRSAEGAELPAIRAGGRPGQRARTTRTVRLSPSQRRRA